MKKLKIKKRKNDKFNLLKGRNMFLQKFFTDEGRIKLDVYQKWVETRYSKRLKKGEFSHYHTCEKMIIQFISSQLDLITAGVLPERVIKFDEVDLSDSPEYMTIYHHLSGDVLDHYMEGWEVTLKEGYEKRQAEQEKVVLDEAKKELK